METEETNVTWEELVELEPRLAEVEKRIIRYKSGFKHFQGKRSVPIKAIHDNWYGYGNASNCFKGDVVSLVGWEVGKDKNPKLRTMEAYNVAYHYLYDLLSQRPTGVANKNVNWRTKKVEEYEGSANPTKKIGKPLTWEVIKKAEPEFQRLEDRIERLHKDWEKETGSRVLPPNIAARYWTGNYKEGQQSLKKFIGQLVGNYSESDFAELRTGKAWSIAYWKLYNLLNEGRSK